MAAARAAASVGQTIYVRGGTYQELATFQTNRQCCFWLNKAVRDKAYNGETVIYTYGTIPTYDTVDYGPIVYAAANGAVLEGITIIGTHAAGDSPGGGDLDCNVLVQNGQGVTLDHCTLTGWGHCGAKTLIGDLAITDCAVQDGGFTSRDHGIYISNTGVVVVSRTAFQRIAGYGVHLYGTPSGVTIDTCIITDNGTAMVLDGGGGILMNGNGGHTITNCQITANHGYGGLVFYQAASINNTITGNTITGNFGEADVVLDHAVQPQTESNNIVGTYWTNTDYAAWPH